MAENIHVKLPDGSVKDVPRGTSALDIAKGISPRLADAALAAQIKPLASNGNGSGGNGHQPAGERRGSGSRAREEQCATDRPHAPAGAGRRTAPAYRPRSRSAGSLSPLVGPPDGRCGAGTISRDQAWSRSGDRERILLRLLSREAVHARGPGSHREEDAGAGEAGRALRARVSAAHRGPGALQVGRRLHEVPLHRAVHRARREDLHLQDRQVHRLLPRSAHPVHRAHQGVQAAQHRGRVLAGRREESATAAHLRHVVLLQEGPRRISAQDRGSEEARPSRAGQAARPVFHPGAGRAGTDLLASQGRHHAQGDGRLDARGVSEARLLAGAHAARGARRSVEDQRPRRLLRAEHVHARWNWTTPTIA